MLIKIVPALATKAVTPMVIHLARAIPELTKKLRTSQSTLNQGVMVQLWMTLWEREKTYAKLVVCAKT